jgi:hypothetical protein
MVVPDLRPKVDAYTSGAVDAQGFLKALGFLVDEDDDGRVKRRLSSVFRYPHMALYDEETLRNALQRAGFDPEPRSALVSGIDGIEAIETVERTLGTIVLEAVKHSDLQPNSLGIRS